MFDKETISNNDEREYIKKAAHGNHDAFGKLVLIYETSIISYLQSLLGSWENARDIAQETFIAAFYDLPRWRPPELLDSDQYTSRKAEQVKHPLAPWLYRIATNQALTFLKRQGRYKRTELDSSLQDLANIHTEKFHTVVESWEDHYIIRETLYEALHQLSTDDALCIVLRFIAGERYAEIADRLGITKEAVRKRVARGLVALRSIYETLDQEEDA